MKLRQSIYNSIGLALAGICSLSLLGRILILMRTNSLPPRHPGEYLFNIILMVMIVFLVGGGGLVNLVKGRLLPWPTVGMIVTYCLSIVFLPLGVWGIIELLNNGRRRRKGREFGDQSRARASSFSQQFLRRCALLSWLLPMVGFIISVLSGATHIRGLIDFAILVCALVVILSLILGIVALCGMREHGPQKILIPSIFGISINGLIILFFAFALIAGFIEGRAELREKRARMIESTGAGQTNTVSQSRIN